MRRGRILGLAILALYALALAASYAVRAPRLRSPPRPSGRQHLEVAAVEGTRRLDETVTLAYREWPAAGSGSDSPAPHERLPVLLLHGSPGSAGDFRTLGPALATDRRVLAPDLPGFGGSTRKIPDYSFEAHAGYVAQMLQQLAVERVHVVAFSMSGGVGLELWEQAPERIESMVMLSAVGVQELELLGSYRVNHLLHGIQLVVLRVLRDLVPHFGFFDHIMLDVPYARNFYDSDQRPLRRLLQSFEPPMLIIHGADDPLVPREAAEEHHRIVPHSELLMLDSSHFFVFRRGASIAPEIESFFTAVEAGEAISRRDARAERVAAAAEPYAPRNLPRWTGPAIPAVLLLLALATLISEDLTCIAAGLLVAQGRIDLVPAMVGCYVGIVGGDLLLFWAGRSLGRRVVRRAPLRWWISEPALDHSSAWLRRRGGWVILITRVLPGTRLPTNLAAGVLHTDFWKFLGYFALAGLFWVPIIVGLTARVGLRFESQLGLLRGRFLLLILALGAVMYLVRHLVVPLLTWPGRRRLLGRLRWLSRWEFWPPWAVYPPVVLYLLYLGLRHRSLTLFTAANPAIPHGGFVGESKADIYARLPADLLPAWRLIPPGPAERRLGVVESLLEDAALSYPLVLKPDAGQRGEGVAVVRCRNQLLEYLEQHPRPVVAQEHVDGLEFGLFWARGPEEATGEIFSITAKVSPYLLGDGKSTLEHLILADRRAVTIADVYLRENPDAETRVPAAGERIRLTEIGAHARGTVFLDAQQLLSPELVVSVQRFVDAFPGFDFGRLDVRTESEETLRRGGPLRVLEINGVTSEATHIYDPRYSLLDAQRTLCAQWRRAFEIGEQRRRQGQRPSGLSELLAAWRDYRRSAR